MTEHVAIERVGSLAVVVDYDAFPTSPREFDNLTIIRGDHDRYNIGDGKPLDTHEDALNRGGIRLLARYLRMCEGAVAVAKLGLYDHSGVSYSIVPLGSEYRGWDSGVVGYVYVTRARWLEFMGTPWTGSDDDVSRVNEAMKSEVSEYSDWASGQVYGYRIVRPCDDPAHEDDEAIDCDHAEELESCWGFIGGFGDYAMTEGKEAAAYHPGGGTE